MTVAAGRRVASTGRHASPGEANTPVCKTHPDTHTLPVWTACLLPPAGPVYGLRPAPCRDDLQTKAIVPFLKRAEEIAAVDPLRAYYCRMYAMDAGMAGGAERGLLLSVVKQLEKDKTALQVRGGRGEAAEVADSFR